MLVKRALAGGVLSGVTNDEKLTIIAAGKASSAMTSAFASEINNPVHGLVAAPQTGRRIEGMECFDVGHPIPTEGSVKAGRRALELASEVPKGNVLVMLLSLSLIHI